LLGKAATAKENLEMKMCRITLLVVVVAILPLSAQAQALIDSRDASGTAAITNPVQPDLTYSRPTTKTKLHCYVFDAFGRACSLSALVAPYAGTMTAVYGWYPGRYNAEDAFRMGNYSSLGHTAGNVAMEFVYSGPHSLLSRMHLKNGHRAPDPSVNP
jgi:hypothetical protein